MTILVRNLARNTTEATLQTLFGNYGKVQSCKLVFDKKTGESKGFGFIEMPKQGESKAAIKHLNGKSLDGNKIRVKKASTRTNQKAPDNTEINKKTESIWNK